MDTVETDPDTWVATDIALAWADAFADALIARDPTGADLFLEDGWWRDILATSWDFSTARERDRIAGRIASPARPSFLRFRIADAIAPRTEDFGPEGEGILAFVSFETSVGSGRGVLRLREESPGRWKAWTLLTALEDVTGHEQARGPLRPHRAPGIRPSSRENWRDLRARAEDFADTEPDVLIVGGGQGALMVAAHLGFWGVGTLVVERNPRIGDNWRNRYRSLVLHDAIWADHLPGLPFPDSWPVYMPKDKLGDWLEFYASAMELNVWTSSSLEESTYDDATGRWTVRIRRGDGSIRELHPRHVVMATGIHGLPKLPDVPGLDEYTGTLVHSSAYTGDEELAGTRALIVGAGNSAHDVAQDLHRRGIAVTMIQRSSTYVISQKTNFDLTIGRLYREDGLPLEDADLLGASFPYSLALERAVGLTQEMARRDRAMLDGLARAGYAHDLGIEGGGGLSKILHGPGGYYIDVGCAQLIIDGEIGITHTGVARFTEDGVEFVDGTREAYDLIVLATGYTTMHDAAGELLGTGVADRCDPVWGLDQEGEIRGIWRPTGHPGLWFMGGPLYIARFHSRFLALQLHADILGLRQGSGVDPQAR